MRYLLITYVRKPNGQIDEQVEITRNLRPKDIQICNVILDFKDKKVERCFIEGKVVSQDWEQLRNYYYTVYPDVIDRIEKDLKGA
jgi:hypothetical protein